MSKALNELFTERYEAPQDLPEQITARYEILSCLKHTEQRRVYLIKDNVDGRRLILKYASGKNGELLEREHRIVSTLKENGVSCSLLTEPVCFFREGDVSYYIREYVEGKTLCSIVEENGPFSQKDAFGIITQLCRQIHILHTQEKPVICRDINPNNVLLCNDGSLRIIDLDSARFYDRRLTTDTICVGTNEMAAPEQFGYTQTNVRTDVYVLGMLLLYISTGSYDRYAPISRRLKRIIAKSTAFDPEERYGSMTEMRRALSQHYRSAVRIAAFAAAAAVICVSVAIGIRIGSEAPADITGTSSEATAQRQEAEFVSAAIENAVRRSLGKAEAEPLYLDELPQVDTLIITGNRVFDSWDALDVFHTEALNSYAAMLRTEEPLCTDDLKLLTGLRYLALDKQGLTSVPDLTGMKLEKLSLMDNELTSLAGIEACSGLKELHLSSNYDLTDISAVSQLSELKTLILSCCVSLNSAEAFKGLPLETLHINYTDISHIDDIGEMTTLRTLMCDDLDAETLSEIARLNGIKYLDLTECRSIKSISQITTMKGLEMLYIGNCPNFSDLSGISELRQLDSLLVNNTALTALPSELAYCNIRTLELRSNDIADYSILADCPSLQLLIVDMDKHDAILELLSGTDITVN